MAVVKPFKGLRPDPKYAEKVASPPYDVLNSEEAREMISDNPYSFLHVVKPEVDVNPSIDLYDDRVYNMGKQNLNKLIEEGILIQDEEECFYIYSQKMGEHLQIGLVAAASVDEYQEGKIKKHENTRLAKEKDRAKHIRVLNAQAGPVFLTYRADEEIDALIEDAISREPVYDFTADDGIKHTFYVIDGEEMKESIKNAFGKLDCLYVADGHHRSAAAARVRDERKAMENEYTGKEEYNYFLTVIFPHNQMHIMDYNRVVNGLNGLSKEDYLERLKDSFDVEEWSEKGKPFKPESIHNFGMYLDEKWYHLSAKDGTFDEKDPVESLDVSILQENLLNPVLGIENLREDRRISFVGGMRGLGRLESLVDSGDYTVAFSMYPTSIEQLMAIADAGKVMPPKSTWFEPKLRSGLITHLL
jgi:uncharacterized protein (DUF1015 family)